LGNVDLSTLANIATALTVITGVFFALLEARRARQDREERAAFSTVQAMFTPEWIRSAALVQAMPPGAPASYIENNERVLRVAWRNLRPYVESQRQKSGSEKNWEWFQWLAEQIERNGSGRTSLKVGAQRANRDWNP